MSMSWSAQKKSALIRTYNATLSVRRTADKHKLPYKEVDKYLRKRPGFPGSVLPNSAVSQSQIAHTLYPVDPNTQRRPVTLPKLRFLQTSGENGTQ